MYEDIICFTPEKDYPFTVSMTGISYCDGSYIINRPHSFTSCIEYIIEGSGTVMCNNRRYTAKKGDVYLLREGTDHYYYSDTDTPWTKIWINFTGRLKPYRLLWFCRHSSVRSGGQSGV